MSSAGKFYTDDGQQIIAGLRVFVKDTLQAGTVTQVAVSSYTEHPHSRIGRTVTFHAVEIDGCPGTRDMEGMHLRARHPASGNVPAPQPEPMWRGRFDLWRSELASKVNSLTIINGHYESDHFRREAARQRLDEIQRILNDMKNVIPS